MSATVPQKRTAVLVSTSTPSRRDVAEPCVNSFRSRVRDELRGVEQFEAQVVVEDWRRDDTHHRPH